ncbi:MAG: ECF-type sigma factor, partial [Bacteroidota bacterium]
MQIIELIKSSTDGKKQSQDELFTYVYDDLRSLARKIRLDWRNENTLNTTALVHEAYLKVCRSEDLSHANKLHFYRICGRAMRFVLKDYLKHKSAVKRGGEARDISISERFTMELSDTSESL